MYCDRLISHISKYIEKKDELLKIAIMEKDKKLETILNSLSMDKDNILWNLIDTPLNNRQMILEIKQCK